MDNLDRILSSEEVLEPSPGFEMQVMDAVREAAAAPPPLPFAWGRFAIGLVACGGWTAASVQLASRIDAAAVRQLADLAPELGAAAAVILASLGALHGRRILVRG